MNYNDLISRQQLLEYLAEEEKMIHDDAERFGINKDVVEGMKQNINSVMDYVEEADVAYDIEKVVEELKENASRYTKKYVTPSENNGYKDTKAVSIHKAVEIVNHGGISDDVCEWKSASDGEFIQNPHTKRLYSNEPSMQNVYCNTCGKKIKVVE